MKSSCFWKDKKHQRGQCRVEQNDQETDPVNSCYGCYLQGRGGPVLGMGQQTPGECEEEEIGADIFQGSPQKRGGYECMHHTKPSAYKAEAKPKKTKIGAQVKGQYGMVQEGIALDLKYPVKYPQVKNHTADQQTQKAISNTKPDYLTE